MNSWIYLLIAGIFEIAWAVGLKFSNGLEFSFTSVLTILGMIASLYFLALSLKNLPLGVAYAIWTGIGTIGTALFGAFLFKEPITILKLFCILLIIVGTIGLKLLTRSQ